MAVYVPGVAEYSTTTGTGSFALEGAIPGFVTFTARVSHNKEVAYRATDGARLEIGRGVFDRTNNLLLRNVVIYPSTGKIDWSAGRRLIYLEIDDDAFDVSSLTGLAAIARTGSAADIVSGVLTVAHGGTGQSSYTNGQLLIGNSTGGTLEKGTLTAPAAGFTITGGGGSITFALANDLSALEAMSGTGLVARTASETYAQRTLTGTSDRISVSNGDGVSGNPTVDIASSYVGQATITTLGTIGTGTWQGTAVGSAYGGTGQSTYTDGQLLIGNSSGGLTTATLTAGSNVTITNGDGSITISATGEGGGGVSYLDELLDVNTSSALAANELLRFGGEDWSNVSLVAGTGVSISHGVSSITITATGAASGNIDDLDDVALGTDLAAGDIFKFDGFNWSNSTIVSGTSVTRLFLSGNHVHPGANTWDEVTWTSVDEDPRGAFNISNPTYVTVPSGVTKVKIIFHARWSNVTGGNRYLAIAPPGGLATPYYGGDIRSGVNEALATVVTPWISVTAGTQISCYHNPGGTGSPVLTGNASITGTFGGATSVEFEWG